LSHLSLSGRFYPSSESLVDPAPGLSPFAFKCFFFHPLVCFPFLYAFSSLLLRTRNGCWRELSGSIFPRYTAGRISLFLPLPSPKKPFCLVSTSFHYLGLSAWARGTMLTDIRSCLFSLVIACFHPIVLTSPSLAFSTPPPPFLRGSSHPVC